MAQLEDHPELFPQPKHPADLAHINQRCLLQTHNDLRVVSVSGIVLAQYAVGDRMSEAHAMVSLVEQGHADQNDVAGAFAYSPRTVRRYQERFANGGLPALARTAGYPKDRRRLPESRDHWVNRLKAEGCSNRGIARRLGVSEKAVRKQLKRLGWHEKTPQQATLPLTDSADPNLSAFTISTVENTPASTPPTADPNLSAFQTPFSLDFDPGNRVLDRLLARVGLLDDAVPLFSPGTNIPRAGVLLAIPALINTGVFDCAQSIFGDIGPAFYGLRTTVLTLLLMALLRIKRPEALKEHTPPDLGRLIGLDRAPEVKTLRRKLSTLAAFGRAVAFGRELACRRVAAHDKVMGFLYADGHVRVYHGKHAIPKTHVARRRLAMSATSDYWVNDQGGEPLFVVTAEANAGMARMLPPLLTEIRSLIVNGDMGFVSSIDRGEKLIRVNFENPDRKVALPLRGNELDLAYAVTVHKSQGSEWPIIVMPIHKNFGNRLPQRNLLYTAVTRAKQLLVMIGDRDEIPKIIRRNEQGRRFTNLAGLLNGKKG